MDDKHTRLHQAVADILTRYGPDTLRQPGDRGRARRVAAFSTGYPALDHALGVGGIPRAALTAFLGTRSTGTTTLMLRTLAAAISAGEMAVWLDLGHSFDGGYAARCGVALDNVLLIRPERPGVTLEMTRLLLEAGGAGIIVIDTALTPWHAEASEVRAAHRILLKSSAALIVLAEPSAHHALVDAADLRLRLDRLRWLWRRASVQGYRTQVTILKNKFAPIGQPLTLTIRLCDR